MSVALELPTWLDDGERRVVACTLVAVEGSSPFESGTTMLVDDRGRIEGSVTGGCVEGALVEEAQRALGGDGPRLRRYGIADDTAVSVGLTCGGTVHVLVAELSPEDRDAMRVVAAAVAEAKPAALATMVDRHSAGGRLAVLDGVPAAGSLGRGERFDALVARDALGLIAQGETMLRHYGSEGETMGAEVQVHIRSFASPPSLIIVGAIDYSVAVARQARELGYRVTICDARAPFVQSPRFERVAEVVVDWPDRYLAGRPLGGRDAVLVFTHDPKFDGPAILAALASGAGYIGALGSRRTHDERLRRLREAGVGEAELARVASPCGLDIGARTPAETAVSILAEIIALGTGRRGGRLAEADVPIHSARVPAGLA